MNPGTDKARKLPKMESRYIWLLVLWIAPTEGLQGERSSDFESCPLSLNCPTKIIDGKEIQLVAKRQNDTVVRRAGRIRYRPEPPVCAVPACMSKPCPPLHRCDETDTSYRCVNITQGCPSYYTAANYRPEFGALALPSPSFFIRFLVRTSSAPIAVYLHENKPTPNYKLQIGDDRTSSYITKTVKDDPKPLVEVGNRSPLLDPSEFREFWVSFDAEAQQLSVGSQDADAPLLMTVAAPIIGPPLPVAKFGMESAAMAEWKLLWHEECAHLLNEET